jgi:XTP/dITP diphosphohydrolase
VEAETALERVNKKFKFRFEYIEQQATKPLSDMTLDEMNMLWNQAKKLNFE